MAIRKAKKQFWFIPNFGMMRAHIRKVKPVPGTRWVKGMNELQEA